MVKLFGWEHKMSEAIKGKRDEELVWIWKDKVKRMPVLQLVKLILTLNIPLSCSLCYPLSSSNISLLTVWFFTDHLYSFVIPSITMLVTYGTYTLIMKESLSGS